MYIYIIYIYICIYIIYIYTYVYIYKYIYIYTYIYIYIYIYIHLKFVEMKKFFTILAIKQHYTDAVYRCLRRQGLFGLNFYIIIFFYDWLTPSQISVFSNLILHNFILISKSNSSVFKLFIFIQIRCTKLKMC